MLAKFRRGRLWLRPFFTQQTGTVLILIQTQKPQGASLVPGADKAKEWMEFMKGSEFLPRHTR